ncbi:MAG TPA: fluoride efflux transporter CrcB [Bacteroidetes bacterium]|nr:fluoride efflux transporter CrcB [Bacteroidota bacterium]
MPTAVLVALGGAAGALARWGLSEAAVRWLGTAAPWGTWGANVLGCFLIGLAVPTLGAGDPRRALAVVGFLGAFTTFSSYTAETLALWDAGKAGLAVANAAGSVVVGLAACALGIALAR